MRRLRVSQNENDRGDFWYTVDRGNASTMLTSETYPSRSNALRAARGFIKAVDPVPVTFTHWTGSLPRDMDTPVGGRRQVTRTIR